MKHFIFLLLPLSIYSQNIKGKIYDKIGTVKDIKVTNTNKQLLTFTDDSGNFEIRAAINDTLHFSSLFYHDIDVKITKAHFNTVIVIELKKVINTLNEVKVISNPYGEEKFLASTETKGLNNSLKEDIKNNPHKYKEHAKYGLDFVYLAKKIVSGKTKKQSEKPRFINYKILDSLFKNDSFFNLKLLKEDLHIEAPLLFLEYCATKNIKTALLSQTSRLELLDILVKYSKEFLRLPLYNKSEDLN
jgi:hypothetical protein